MVTPKKTISHSGRIFQSSKINSLFSINSESLRHVDRVGSIITKKKALQQPINNVTISELCWDFDLWAPDLQVVGILIVSFPKHELCNANLQKGRSDGSGPTTSPMIKLEKNMEREKSSGGVEVHTFPSGGSF